jgi:hypothetical protein
VASGARRAARSEWAVGKESNRVGKGLTHARMSRPAGKSRMYMNTRVKFEITMEYLFAMLAVSPRK